MGRQLRWCSVLASILFLLMTPTASASSRADELEVCGTGGPMRANAWSPFSVNAGVADGCSAYEETRKPTLPTDAHPWFFARCTDPEQAFDCALVHETIADAVIEVAAEGLEEACDDPYQTAHPIRVLPAAPLLPTSRYALRCDSTPFSTDYLDFMEDETVAGIITRSAATSLAPPDLQTTKAELIRRDDTCCGDDPLHLVVTPPQSDELDAFAREGGVIEVLHEGDVWYLRPGGGELPWTERGVTVTAIAADGTRGEALEIPAEAIPEELVLNNFDCALGRRLSGSALWLLMPLVFLRWSRRHARRREDRRYGP